MPISGQRKTKTSRQDRSSVNYDVKLAASELTTTFRDKFFRSKKSMSSVQSSWREAIPAQRETPLCCP